MTATSLLKEHRQGAGAIFPEVAFCAPPHTHMGAVRESAALAFPSILAFSSPLHPRSGLSALFAWFCICQEPSKISSRLDGSEERERAVLWGGGGGANQSQSRRRPGSCHAGC